MKLDSEFFKLPVQFDAERLREEASQFTEQEWRPHPTDYKGNSAIVLISSRGEYNDAFQGPMLPTPTLERCPYIQQVLAAFNTVYSRSRLMRLAARSEVPEHCDINYHWYNRVRIHVPIITEPEVRFFCNGHDVHMAPGEAWIFDTWKMHRVINPVDKPRIHLVADTTGTTAFWDLVARGWRPFGTNTGEEIPPVFVPYQPGTRIQLQTERYTHTEVMPCGELDALASDLIVDLQANQDADRSHVDRFCALVRNLQRDWRSTWVQYGTQPEHLFRYQSIVHKIRQDIAAVPQALGLASNNASAVQTLEARILNAACNPDAASAANEQRPAGINIKKVGRNEPCPCGSGKKYKQCHG